MQYFNARALFFWDPLWPPSWAWRLSGGQLKRGIVVFDVDGLKYWPSEERCNPRVIEQGQSYVGWSTRLQCPRGEARWIMQATALTHCVSV